MVGMEVRQEQQRHPPHPEGAQAGVHRPRFGPRVHDHGRAGARGQDGGVALPDGALHIAPVGRRPARERTGELRRPQQRGEQQHCQTGARPRPTDQPRPEQYGRPRGRGQQQSAAEPAGPGELRAGQPGARPRHRGDPPGRPGRAPGEQLRGGRVQRGGRQRGEAEHGRRSGRELRQQVARHPDEADPGGEHRDHRRAHRLRGGRGGERLRGAGRHPAPPQGPAPPRGEGQQGAGGEDGQQESGAAGQPRVVEEEQQRGRGQRRQQRPPPTGGDGQQADRPAGRGPQHAGVGPADGDERQHQRRPREGGRPQGEPEAGGESAPFGELGPSGRPDEQEQHHGQVGPGDGQQVQQVGGPERLVQVGRDPGGVPDDERRQQRPLVGGEPLGGRAQPLPEPPGRLLDGRGRAGHGGSGTGLRPQHGDRPLAGPAGPQPALHGDPGGRQQPRPSRVGGEDAHRCGHPDVPPAGRPHPGQQRVHHDQRRAAVPAGGPRVGGDGHLGDHPGVLPGQLGDGPGPLLGPGQTRRGGALRGAQQRERGGRPGPPQPLRAPAPRAQQQPGSREGADHARGGPRAGRAERGRGRRPGRRRGHHQPQIRRPPLGVAARAGPGAAGRTPDGRPPVHGRTSFRRSAKRRSPI
ncbi:hypothetical protein GCM10009731_09440 [Streptomyces globosus]